MTSQPVNKDRLSGQQVSFEESSLKSKTNKLRTLVSSQQSISETEPLLSILSPSYAQYSGLPKTAPLINHKKLTSHNEEESSSLSIDSVYNRNKKNTLSNFQSQSSVSDGLSIANSKYNKSFKPSSIYSFRNNQWGGSRESGLYDENKQDLVQENNGLRAWYDDYSTIDWIHDYVKEKVRLRRLRKITGFIGWIFNLYDASQAWILVALIGICCGCIAAGISVGTEFLSDIKSGYCTKNIFYNRSFCCWGKEESLTCYEWQRWSQAFHVDAFSDGHWFDFLAYIFFATLFAMLAVLLVYHTTKPIRISKKHKTDTTKYYAAGSGIPEVKTILGGFVMRGFLGFRTLWVKSVGLTLAVSSGMNLGKEGPLVHIACCIGNVLSRFFDKYNYNEGKRREILSASCAAGVAVAFGAPIGGVLFSLEEASYYFPSKTMWRSFLCALIAAMTLKIINPFQTGKTVLFQVTFDQEWHTFELALFLIIGIFGGVYGALFCKLNIMWTKLRRKSWLGRRPILEVFMVVVLSSSLGYINVFTRMASTELVAELFEECKGLGNGDDGLCLYQLNNYKMYVQNLMYAIIEKFLLTVITFGIKTPAGIFIPSMAIGACFGRMLGLTAQHFQQTYPTYYLFEVCGDPGVNCFTPGVYAMVGAAAALAGVTRMTVSLVVIMFELTGSLTYALPIMLSVMVSKWVGDALVPHSIYDNLIELNNYPFLDNKREYFHTKGIHHILERNLEVIRTEEMNSIGQIKDKLTYLADSGYPDGGFPILDGFHLVGYIAANDLEYALDESTMPDESAPCFFRQVRSVASSYDDSSDIECPPNDLTPYVDQAPLSISINTSMEVVLELFIKLGVRYLCVLENNQFVGVIYKKRLLAYLHDIGEN